MPDLDDIEFRRRLSVVWTNEPPYRYVPRSYKGGPGWGVFDRKNDCFVPDEKVAGMTFEDCIEKIAH